MQNIPTNPETGFKVMVQGVADYQLEAVPISCEDFGVMICICSEEGAIYITKDQAKAFFDL